MQSGKNVGSRRRKRVSVLLYEEWHKTLFGFKRVNARITLAKLKFAKAKLRDSYV